MIRSTLLAVLALIAAFACGSSTTSGTSNANSTSSSTSSSTANPLLGAWSGVCDANHQSSAEHFEFQPNGRLLYGSAIGQYRVLGNNHVELTLGGGRLEHEATYSVSANTLTLNDTLWTSPCQLQRDGTSSANLLIGKWIVTNGTDLMPKSIQIEFKGDGTAIIQYVQGPSQTVHYQTHGADHLSIPELQTSGSNMAFQVSGSQLRLTDAFGYTATLAKA